MNIQIKVKNIAAIRSAFAKSPFLMTKNLRIAIQRAVLVIGARSRRNTPVRTGRLRSSTYERFYASLKAEIGTHTNYDLFVHEGTRFMRARPYLRLAVQSEQTTIDREFKTAVDKTLEQIARRTG